MEGIIHISVGGPVQKISVKGKIFTFEFHPYCGPIALKKNGDALKDQPNEFLEAASLWIQQGRKIENGLCVYYHEPVPITQKIGGRSYRIVGYQEPQRGE